MGVIVRGVIVRVCDCQGGDCPGMIVWGSTCLGVDVMGAIVRTPQLLPAAAVPILQVAMLRFVACMNDSFNGLKFNVDRLIFGEFRPQSPTTPNIFAHL